jgi:integrase
MRGHVRKRGKSWSVVYDENPGEDGKRHQRWKGGFRTKTEAEEALSDILSKLGRGDYVMPTKLTLGEFLTAWVDGLALKNAPLTVATYRRVVRKHVAPTLGRMPLQKLTTADLNALYAKLSEGGLSPSTVRLVHNVVHKALEAAVRQQLAIRNVAGYADRPRIPRVQRRTWTASELRQFLDANADERLYAAWVFAATTGARRGEVLGLRWFDLDLVKGRAAIVQTVIPTGGKRWTFSTTKTGAGRQVALDSTTVEALKAHCEQQLAEREKWGEAYHDHDLVFTRENGEPLDPNGFTDLFGTALKRAKLPKIRLHDLRHTHATLCLSAGVHPKVVSERLGHSSVKMTLDRYSHAIPALEESAAELVASLVFAD